jgi:fructokinase
VGRDAFGDFLVDTLERHGLSSRLVKRSIRNTTLAFVSLDENGERSFEFVRGADEDLELENIPQEVLDQAGIFHFASATAFLGGSLEKTYFQLLGLAKQQDKLISFDPNYREALFKNRKEEFIEKAQRFMAKADLIKVSEDEVELLTKKTDLQEAVQELLEMGAGNILVTLGKEGTLLVTKDQQEIIPSIEVEMVDATGAGDAFIGALLGQLASQSQDRGKIGEAEGGFNRDLLGFANLKELVKRANAAAALTVTQRGALESIPSGKEVEAKIKK